MAGLICPWKKNCKTENWLVSTYTKVAMVVVNFTWTIENFAFKTRAIKTGKFLTLGISSADGDEKVQWQHIPKVMLLKTIIKIDFHMFFNFKSGHTLMIELHLDRELLIQMLLLSDTQEALLLKMKLWTTSDLIPEGFSRQPDRRFCERLDYNLLSTSPSLQLHVPDDIFSEHWKKTQFPVYVPLPL